MTDSLIERMARAHWDHDNPDVPWFILPKFRREQLESRMRAAWAVAAEPTEAMTDAGYRHLEQDMTPRQLPDGFPVTFWQAMHGAAENLEARGG